jgi:hypothetical protein
MTYKQYKKALAVCEELYDNERSHINKLKEFNRMRWRNGKISEKEYNDEKERLDAILTNATGRNDRYRERVKMHFAMQDAPAKVGDIIWTSQLCMRVEQIKLAAFDFPMLKYFGVQLTLKGVPSKIQKEYPQGGIYQKNITSVNGEPYIYKARE